MNDHITELAERVRLMALLPAEDQIELEWVRVLDCGALGPSREGPILFHQYADDWNDHHLTGL